MSLPFRPIGKVRELILTTGLDIAHFYDDIVISDHSVFIIRFDAYSESRIHLYFNSDCEEGEKNRIYRYLLPESRSAGLDLILSGAFSLEQIENTEELKITFYEKSAIPN